MRAARKVVLVGLLAVVACAIGQASAASSATTSVRCSLNAHLKSGLSDRGALAGSVGCGHRFGKGSYQGRYREHVEPSSLTGGETGSSKFSFNAGTVRGTYVLPPAPIAGTAAFHGTFHISGGTGRFKHVSGTLTMTCAHRIPLLTRCALSGPVTGI